MGNYFEDFFQKPPEKIIEWNDTETNAHGWLVYNSLRGGAAGGGTRMRYGCTLKEVCNLAKIMEIKFSISGPMIGGAKSGINYQPKDNHDKQSVLRRWFKFIEFELKNNYGTGGDYNVGQEKDVIPLLQELNIVHPQEGIVRGHLHFFKKNIQDEVIKQLYQGVRCSVEELFPEDKTVSIADVATGFSVIESLKMYYQLRGESLEGKRILVEGFGNVGSAAAYFAEKDGAVVVGILEKEWCVYSDKGLDIEQMYYRARSKGLHSNDFIKFTEYPYDEKNIHADVYIPAATSGSVDCNRLENLESMGVSVLVCGANDPFDSIETLKKADQKFFVIADFIANAGMARVFAYLMQPGCALTSNAILRDIASCIEETMVGVGKISADGRSLYANAGDFVMKKLKTNT